MNPITLLVAAVIVVFAVIAAARRTAMSGSLSLQQTTIARWAECWSTQDLDGLLLLFAADAVYEDVPMAVQTHGLGELRVFAASVLSRLPDISFEVTSMFTDGSSGSAEWVMRGTREGKSFEVRGVSAFEFAGGKIRRCSDYWDMATYLKQLAS